MNTGGGWKVSLANLLKKHNSVKVDGSVASYATRDKRAEVLYAGFRDLRALGFKLDDAQQFAGRHMSALVKCWEEQGKAPATIENNISNFRVFSRWIGKAGMVEASVKYASTLERVTRCYVAKEEKTWSAKGKDIYTLISLVEVLDQRVALQLELQYAFGLRARESWQLRPHLADKGAFLAVTHGAKGGRARSIPIVNEKQRDVLDRAKKLAQTNKSTSDQSMSLSQWKNHYYYIVRKAGICRKEGVTSHGLRHERLNEVYKEVTSHPSPVQGGKIADVGRDLHDAGRHEVVEVAGHSRPTKAGAYIGSYRTC